jgi:hypothetical protein
VLSDLALIWATMPAQVNRAEEFLKRRIPVGSTFKKSRIEDEAGAQVKGVVGWHVMTLMIMIRVVAVVLVLVLLLMVV